MYNPTDFIPIFPLPHKTPSYLYSLCCGFRKGEIFIINHSLTQQCVVSRSRPEVEQKCKEISKYIYTMAKLERDSNKLEFFFI